MNAAVTPIPNSGAHLATLDIPAPNDSPKAELMTPASPSLMNFDVPQNSDSNFVIPASVTATAVRGESVQLLPLPELPPPNPMEIDLDDTYNSRMCIAGHESSNYGPLGKYVAEWGGRPGSRDGSTASGAYQWLNSSWQTYEPLAEAYYGYSLLSEEERSKGGGYHAAFAPPYVQDLVTAFALKHPDLAQGGHPWPYHLCWALVGSQKDIRPDGPEFLPTEYIQAQINAG